MVYQPLDIIHKIFHTVFAKFRAITTATVFAYYQIQENAML